MTNLIGKYQITNSNLVSNSTHLVIAQRKKVEGTKPKQYLLLKTPQNTFKYISSLYPSKVAQMAYEIDYTGCKYLVIIDQVNQVADIKMLHNSITVTFTPKL